MKKFFYCVFASLFIITTGCASNGDEQSERNQEQINKNNTEDYIQTSASIVSEINSSIDNVLATLEEMKNQTEQSPDSTTDIQAIGKKLEENWDQIEKQVEEKYPEFYEDIERSLYPLIAEAKKDRPNVVMVKQLTDETTQKVKAFKEVISS
ncbi:hypothetical protein [Lentibacillus sp. Marseille-P4043]|uniref:hypothetical protein n=1 Tax=Lentibacillus sp. Marseille-P4043 TaxID=2040293 RepID=UPI000D0B49CB|nr:hypothetical protein [Lentibacillus sp. Marseille-P4043]